MSRKRQRLTVFLLKSDIIEPTTAIRTDLTQPPVLIQSNFGEGAIYIGGNPCREPDWLSLLQSIADGQIESLRNQSSRAVMLVHVNNRFFAFTFGYGRHLLKDEVYERDFGIRCVLNAVEPTSLLSIDKAVFDELTVQSRTQTSRAAAVPAFGLDPVRDLVRAVTGRPHDVTRFGKAITGSDSLLFSVDVTGIDFNSICGHLIELYESASYRREFDWFDNLRLVNDPSVIADLNNRLVTALIARDSNRIHLAPPDIVDWDNIAGFSFAKRGDPKDILSIDDYFAYLDQQSSPNLTIEQIKRHRVYVRNIQDGESKGRWPVYNCIVFETEGNPALHVLTTGKWIRVEPSFVTKVTDFIRNVPDCSISMPDALSNEKEGAYNIRAASQSAGALLCLDKKLVYTKEYRGGIELCDLISPGGHFVHVKPRHSSSTLSHLFSQARVSGELLVDDEIFRQEAKKLIELLSPGFPLKFDIASANPTSHEVVFAIIDNDIRPFHDRLPFFSKVNMRQAVRSLTSLGFGISKIKVNRQ